MGVRTQDEIFAELRKLYPRWLLDLFGSIGSEGTESGETLIRACYQALAEANHDVELAVEAAVEQTYIDQATGRWLDLHGSERSKPRLTGEQDPPYRVRIRAIENMVTRPAIIARVAAMLLVTAPKWYLFEHENDAPFYSRGAFLNRDARAFAEREAFTLFIPPQVPGFLDDAFYNRESFIGGKTTDRGNFMGSKVPSTGAQIYHELWTEMKRIRAAGVAQHIQILE